MHSNKYPEMLEDARTDTDPQDSVDAVIRLLTRSHGSRNIAGAKLQDLLGSPSRIVAAFMHHEERTAFLAHHDDGDGDDIEEIARAIVLSIERQIEGAGISLTHGKTAEIQNQIRGSIPDELNSDPRFALDTSMHFHKFTGDNEEFKLLATGQKNLIYHKLVLFIEESASTQDAKRAALVSLNANFPYALELHSWASQFNHIRNHKTIGFVEQWLSGQFSYQQPIFQTPEDVTLFCRCFATIVSDLLNEKDALDEIDSEKFSQLMNDLQDSLYERIIQYEEQLRIDLAKKEEERVKQEAEAKAAKQARLAAKKAQHVKNAQAKRARDAATSRDARIKRQEFLAHHQPGQYPAGSKALLDKLRGCTTGHNAKTAGTLLTLLEDEEILTSFDLRGGPAVESLASQWVLAPFNVRALAVAFGLDNVIRDHTANAVTKVDGAAAFLRVARQSPRISITLEKLNATLGGSLLLASLLFTPEQTKHVAVTIARNRAEAEKNRAIMEDLAKETGITDHNEWQDFATIGTKEAIQYLEAEAALQAAEEKLRVNHAAIISGIGDILQHDVAKRVVHRRDLKLDLETLPPQPETAELRDIWRDQVNLLNPVPDLLVEKTDSNKVIVSCKEYPHLSFQISRSAPSDAFKKEFDKLHKDYLQLHVFDTHLAILCSPEVGFQVIQEEGQVRLCHTVYTDLGEPKINGATKWDLTGEWHLLHQRLEEAATALENQKAVQDELLETARLHGITVRRENDVNRTIVLSLEESDQEFALGENGFLSDRELEVVQNLIFTVGDIGDNAEPLEDLPVPEDKPLDVQTWTPNPSDHVMVIDASTLITLNTPRKGSKGRTHLDYLTATAHLPGTVMVIPAFVYYEFSGELPNCYGAIHKFTGLDQHEVPEEAKRFSQTAWHARWQFNACQITRPGNATLVVVETPTCTEMFKQMEGVLNTQPHEFDAWRRDNIHGKSIGDKCILELTDAMANAGAGHITVVTDDRGLQGHVSEDHSVTSTQAFIAMTGRLFGSRLHSSDPETEELDAPTHRQLLQQFSRAGVFLARYFKRPGNHDPGELLYLAGKKANARTVQERYADRQLPLSTPALG